MFVFDFGNIISTCPSQLFPMVVLGDGQSLSRHLLACRAKERDPYNIDQTIQHLDAAHVLIMSEQSRREPQELPSLHIYVLLSK